MKRLLPLYLAVLALNGWAQTLESNVRTVLARLELDGKVEVVSVDRHVSLRPLGCEDAIRQWIEAHHAQVKKQLPLFSRWYHKSRESYWVVAKPSLHVTWRPEYGVWDAHLDKWCPRFRQPGTLLGHLALEIARNALTGHPTSQVEIWRLLNRRQPYNTDLPAINHFASDPLRVSLHHRSDCTCPSMLQPPILRRCDGLPEPLGQLLPVLEGGPCSSMRLTRSVPQEASITRPSIT
jgi:hypothetical protein